MRRSVLHLGETLANQGLITDGADVFFLIRQELQAVLQGQQGASYIPLVVKRRLEWQKQRRLVPPLSLGKLPPMVQSVFDSYDNALRSPSTSKNIVLRGAPASPGRATGPVRVIRGPEEFNRLQPGDILVAPATMPAWTPLFTLAAAVVTDTGGIAAHASIIAREYGIPAVVGTGDGTILLRDDQTVTVDGNAGTIEVQ